MTHTSAMRHPTIPRTFCVLAAFLLSLPAIADSLLVPPAGAGPEPSPPWHVVGLPEQSKPFTQFTVVDLDGHRAIRVEADQSYGNLLNVLKPPGQVPLHLSWQWRVERALKHPDLHTKGGDDTAIKVCVFFDESMDNVSSFVDRQMLRFARSKSVDPVPAATVCYVWDATIAADTAIDSAFTRRVRYLVVQSSPTQPAKWIAEKRDLGADFMRLFGDEAKAVPPILGIVIGADADNTHDHSIAYVADIVLAP